MFPPGGGKMTTSVEIQGDKIVTVDKAPFDVKLTYFKASGKYYSEGTYKTNKLIIYEIFDEAKDMLSKGIRPGLVDGHNEFYVIVEIQNHPLAYPCLIHPDRFEDD
jgi:hypothetical protein